MVWVQRAHCETNSAFASTKLHNKFHFSSQAFDQNPSLPQQIPSNRISFLKNQGCLKVRVLATKYFPGSAEGTGEIKACNLAGIGNG